jgi:hypothetical protein
VNELRTVTARSLIQHKYIYTIKLMETKNYFRIMKHMENLEKGLDLLSDEINLLTSGTV